MECEWDFMWYKGDGGAVHVAAVVLVDEVSAQCCLRDANGSEETAITRSKVAIKELVVGEFLLESTRNCACVSVRVRERLELCK